jgi:phospholipid/cholesterol/gamma-HCH transport system permease protein
VGRFFREIWKPKQEYEEFINQCYWIGYKSLTLVGITGFIMGLVLTIQSRPTLVDFGAVSWLPAMVSVSLVREISPVITALICAGKIGSGIGAELGSMRVTEQIDALQMLETDPVDYLVVPRVLACCIMLPFLTIFALCSGIGGGMMVAYLLYGVPNRIFLDSVQSFLSLGDIISTLIKAMVFGILIAIIGSSWGLTTQGGAKGVGQSTTAAVVTSLLAIFVSNFFLSWIMFQGTGSAALQNL